MVETWHLPRPRLGGPLSQVGGTGSRIRLGKPEFKFERPTSFPSRGTGWAVRNSLTVQITALVRSPRSIPIEWPDAKTDLTLPVGADRFSVGEKPLTPP